MENKVVMKRVEIYTDGSCLKNPNGQGGWAAILLYNDNKKELSGYEASTTNNKMELLAIIEGLKALKDRCNVTVYSDSQYAINGMTKWIKNWIRRDFTEVKNKELWQQLYKVSQLHNVTWKWVKGHANNKYNNQADELANNAARSGGASVTNTTNNNSNTVLVKQEQTPTKKKPPANVKVITDKDSVEAGRINPCPKCNTLMEYREHKEITAKQLDKVYYYKWWNYCSKCKHVQHYEEAKVHNTHKIINGFDRLGNLIWEYVNESKVNLSFQQIAKYIGYSTCFEDIKFTGINVSEYITNVINSNIPIKLYTLVLVHEGATYESEYEMKYVYKYDSHVIDIANIINSMEESQPQLYFGAAEILRLIETDC